MTNGLSEQTRRDSSHQQPLRLYCVSILPPSVATGQTVSGSAGHRRRRLLPYRGQPAPAPPRRNKVLRVMFLVSGISLKRWSGMPLAINRNIVACR